MGADEPVAARRASVVWPQGYQSQRSLVATAQEGVQKESPRIVRVLVLAEHLKTSCSAGGMIQYGEGLVRWCGVGVYLHEQQAMGS